MEVLFRKIIFAAAFAFLVTAKSTEDDIAELQAKLQDVEQSLQQLSALVTDVEVVFGEKLAKLEERLEGVDAKNEQQDEDLTDSISKATNTVGFSAYLSGATELQHGDTVIFDTAITHYGTTAAYSSVCGTFRAPVHGLYFFTVNFITDGRVMANTNLDIMVNGKRKCIAYGDGAHRHTTGVCSIVVELQVGDTVHVEHEDPHGDGGAIYGGPYATFTGFLNRQLS